MTSLEMIVIVARRLGTLRDEVAFLGGATTSFLITDPAYPQVRPTLDVDVIVEIASRMEYYKLEERLRRLGFIQAIGEDDPICRWMVEGVKIDVMPTEPSILGFSNRWYADALKYPETRNIADDLYIRLVTAPYFLATKMEAFLGRGKGDYLASHDMEDIVTLIDGRGEIIDEIGSSDPELKVYLAERFSDLLNDGAFYDALPGYLYGDAASQARRPIIIKRMQKVISIGLPSKR
jgi:predicted nucleotidyltransferase